MNPAITIIVPVYNAEKFLHRCLDSIIYQTFTNWECILIDDGSPDNSGAICDDYVARDSRFRVIHQKNKGVSAARNAGLDSAKGNWIGFVDSDDWIEPNMYEYLYNNTQKMKADCVICSFFGQHKHQIRKICSKKEVFKFLFLVEGFGGYSFLRLISAEKIGGIRYDSSLSYLEDTKFFYEVFHNCRKVYWDNTPLYHYIQNPESVTHKIGLSKPASQGLHFMRDLANSEQNGYLKRIIRISTSNFVIELAMQYVLAAYIDNSEFEFLKSLIKKDLFLVLFTRHISLGNKRNALILINKKMLALYVKLIRKRKEKEII